MQNPAVSKDSSGYLIQLKEVQRQSEQLSKKFNTETSALRQQVQSKDKEIQSLQAKLQQGLELKKRNADIVKENEELRSQLDLAKKATEKANIPKEKPQELVDSTFRIEVLKTEHDFQVTDLKASHGIEVFKLKQALEFHRSEVLQLQQEKSLLEAKVKSQKKHRDELQGQIRELSGTLRSTNSNLRQQVSQLTNENERLKKLGQEKEVHYNEMLQKYKTKWLESFGKMQESSSAVNYNRKRTAEAPPISEPSPKRSKPNPRAEQTVNESSPAPTVLSNEHTQLAVKYPAGGEKWHNITLRSIAQGRLNGKVPVTSVVFSKEWQSPNLVTYLRKLPSEKIDLWLICDDLSNVAAAFLGFYRGRQVVACCKQEDGSIVWALPMENLKEEVHGGTLFDILAEKKDLISFPEGQGFMMITMQERT